MAEQRAVTTMKRRGLVAGAAALIAGIVARQAAQPVLAAPLSGDSTSAVTAGVTGTNSTDRGTGVLGFASGTTGDGTGVRGQTASSGDGASGVFGLANASSGQVFGVFGQIVSPALNASGVYGVAQGGVTNGVWGENTGNALNACGVFGLASRTDTMNVSVGVWGRSQSKVDGAIGTFGETNATTSAGIGVSGRSASPAGIGVKAQGGAYGVYATASNLHGVYAECGTTQGAGALVGVTNVSTGVAFQARANSPAVAAGFFVGNVSVFGALGVSGGKFAVVKSADGKYRAMHAVEAPEAWFEDVGKARLSNGSATVTLDPLFAQHIHTDDYHVFLTTYGVTQGLDVVAQNAGGFVVQERNRGTSSGRFSWRVMAKRADLKDERMPVWEVPPGADLPASAPVHAGPQPAPPFRPPQTPASPQGSTPTPGASVSPGVQPAPPPRP
jgi:hypothetical protein